MQDGLNIENGVLVSYDGDAHSIVIPEGVRAIGKEVFKGMAWITDISLPQSLTEIGSNAFKGCRRIEHIIFPEGLERIGDLAFHRCHSLTEAILPDSVTSIGNGAFLYCDSLKRVRAFGVKRIENQTFANNTQLCEIGLSSDVDCSNFTNDTFTGCMGIKDIYLSDGTSFHADDLLSLFIADKDLHPVVRALAKSVYQSVEIENGVLYKLHVNLKDFELPEGITCIEKGCFFNKTGIVSMTLPASLARIKSNAFGNCINLEQVTLKNGDVVIDEDAFRGCSNLKRIAVGGEVYHLSGINYEENAPYIIRRIGDQVIGDFYISGRVLMAYTGSENRVAVPEGIEVIGEGCFEDNEKLDRVIMPDTVREIHENAFRNCVCMQSAVMPENLQSICRGAFENCRKLIRFNVPSGLKEVGFAAFRGCQRLELTQFETGTPPAVRVKESEYGADDIPAYSFCGNDTLTEVVIDKPVTIGKYAFSNCPNIKTVTINAPGCIIERNAFEKCGSLREVRVLAGKLGRGAFSFCRSLEKAEISGASVLEAEVFAGCCSLREVKLSAETKEIGRRCFDECTSLSSIGLENVRIIGERAFERCDSLTEIRVADAYLSYHAFADCPSVKRIVLDSGTVLQSGVFFGCTFADTVVLDGEEYHFSGFEQSRNTAENKLPSRVQEVIGSVYSCFEVNKKNGIVKYRGDASAVRIPDDIVSAEDEAFRDHIRVTDIVFPAGFRYSGKLTFSGTGWLEKRRRETVYNIVNGMLTDAAGCGETAEIPESIERICSWAFAGNTALRELTIKNSRVVIDVFAFRNCINLKCIHYSDGNTYTLEKYSDVTEKDYPETVRRIFSECMNCFKLSGGGVLTESTGNIKNLVFPGGIKEIADEVYVDCNLLESIVLSQETAVIGRSAFKNSKWLGSVSGAAGVESIGAQAFSGCRSLESIDLSDRLEKLGKRAFEHCCELKEIHISDKLTVIPEKAFFRCKSLKRIVIPKSVKRIEPQAFAFCCGLEEVIFHDRDSIDIAEDAFAWCDKL